MKRPSTSSPDRRGAARAGAARSTLLAASVLGLVVGACGGPRTSEPRHLECSLVEPVLIDGTDLVFGPDVAGSPWVAAANGTQLLTGPIGAVAPTLSLPEDTRFAGAARTDAGPVAVVTDRLRLRAWQVDRDGVSPLSELDAVGGAIFVAPLDGGTALAVWSSAERDWRTIPAGDTTSFERPDAVERAVLADGRWVTLDGDGTLRVDGDAVGSASGARALAVLDDGAPAADAVPAGAGDTAATIGWLAPGSAGRTVVVRDADGTQHRVHADRPIFGFALLPAEFRLLVLDLGDSAELHDLDAPEVRAARVPWQAVRAASYDGRAWIAHRAGDQTLVGELRCGVP